MQRDLSRRAKEDLDSVCSILRRWDPIGVRPGPGENEGPMDEYDSYAPGILRLLLDGRDLVRITSHLANIRTVSIGLPEDHASDEAIAQELLGWWTNRRPRSN